MNETTLLQELEALAEELEIEVRYDSFEGRGGLCRYGGKTCLIVNRELGIEERLNLFAHALSQLSLDTVFVRPQVREYLEKSADNLF
jgi:hypothetical protein